MFFSTSEVYAGTLKYHDFIFPTPETTPLTLSDISVPRTSYMLSKLYGEAMVIQSGLPYLILRPHNIYGPNMGMSHVIPQLVEKSISYDKFSKIKVESVSHTRAFCYIDDAIEQITRLIHMNIFNDTFNIGNMKEEVSIGELASKILTLTSKNQNIESIVIDNHSPIRRCPDISKLESSIGELNYIPLETGLKKYINWYYSK
jgi:nucleoside-diphosphate-sugar epimerase